MKSRKRVGDTRTPIFIDLMDERWPDTTAATERPERKSVRSSQREE